MRHHARLFNPMSSQRNRRLIAAAAALAVAGGIAAAVLVTTGGPASEPVPPPPSDLSQLRVPSQNPRSSPPWGFTGGGWGDLCYRQTTTALTPLLSVRDTDPCPPASTRITGATQIALTARAGADVDRLGTTWGTIEPQEGTFNWEPIVSRYDAMVRDGIHPIVVAYGSPGWARVPDWNQPGMCSLPNGGCAFPPAPNRIPEWQAFVRGLMVHMPEMEALEVWNEPNSARYFAPHPNPALYVQMLRAADEAARQVNFDRPIITGGLAPASPIRAGKFPAPEFLSRVYELAGKDAFDGIGAHPYPNGSPWVASMTTNLNQLRRVAARFGDGSKPLWVTELGLGSTPSGDGRYNVPLDQQGPILNRMYRSTRGNNVRSFVIYTLNDTGVPENRFAVYGVLTPAFRPKPAYCYLAQHLGGTDPCAG